MGDLKTLKKKLRQPITRDNWQDLMLSSLIYGILRYGFDEAIYPYREIIIHPQSEDLAQLEEIAKRAKIRRELESITAIEEPYIDAFSEHLNGYNIQAIYTLIGQPTKSKAENRRNEQMIRGLLNSCGLVFSQEDGNYPKEFFYWYLWGRSGYLDEHGPNYDLTKKDFIRRLSHLLRISSNLTRLGTNDKSIYEIVTNILTGTSETEDPDKTIDSVVKILYLLKNSQYYRDLLAFISSPTKHLDRDYDEILRDLGQLYKLQWIGNIIDQELEVKDEDKLISIVSHEQGRMDSRRDYMKSKMLEILKTVRYVKPFESFSDQDIEYITRPIEGDIEITVQTLSRRARIIKTLRDEGREVDYKEVSRLARIRIPAHLAIAKRGEGITSIVYECIYDKLDIRPRALRIFDLRDSEHSTSLEGVRKDYGDFEIFRRGMVFQEELGREHDFVVKVYNYGRLEDGTYYSIEELIDWTLEEELELRQEVRESMFSRTFQEVARRLCILHEGIDPGEKPEYQDLDEETIDEEISLLKKRFHVDKNKRISEPITHCDIKLSNIGRRKGEIKLLDFQTAVVGSKPITTTHFHGTRQYAAPESILHNSHSTQSDIYSLGVCMYKYLTGRFPTDYGMFNDKRESLEHLRKRLERTTDLKHNRQIREAREELTIHAGIIGDTLNWNPDRRVSARRLYLTFSKVEEDIFRMLTKERPGPF